MNDETSILVNWTNILAINFIKGGNKNNECFIL